MNYLYSNELIAKGLWIYPILAKLAQNVVSGVAHSLWMSSVTQRPVIQFSKYGFCIKDLRLPTKPNWQNSLLCGCEAIRVRN